MTWLLMLALAASPAAPSVTGPAAAKAPAAAVAKKAPAKKEAKKESKKAAAAPPAEAPALPPIPEPYRWKVPRQLDWVDSMGVQESEGVPMVLEMARSSLSVEELIQHFADDFMAAGLFIPPLAFQGSVVAEPRLTALDPLRLVAYTVIFQPNPDRTTTLYLGTADMSGYQPGTSALEWAPVMPGAQKLMRTELEVAQSAVYSVRASEVEVQTFYREALGARGYTEVEPGLFQRGGEALRVFSEPDGPDRMVGLTRKTQGGEASAPAMVAPAPTP